MLSSIEFSAFTYCGRPKHSSGMCPASDRCHPSKDRKRHLVKALHASSSSFTPWKSGTCWHHRDAATGGCCRWPWIKREQWVCQGFSLAARARFKPGEKRYRSGCSQPSGHHDSRASGTPGGHGAWGRPQTSPVVALSFEWWKGGARGDVGCVPDSKHDYQPTATRRSASQESALSARAFPYRSSRVSGR